MSSRYLLTKHRLLPLSRANVELDLRHCEAHWSTCGGYAHQRFIHRNRELAVGGRFGASEPLTVAPQLGQDATSGLVGYAMLDYHASFSTDMPTHYLSPAADNNNETASPTPSSSSVPLPAATAATVISWETTATETTRQ